MKSNLASLHAEIVKAIESHGLVVFHAEWQDRTGPSTVQWDHSNHPDYREYIAAAERAGVKVMTVFGMEFDEARIAEATEQLEASNIPREDRRDIERALNEARAYEGFICEIQLSFDSGTRVYEFNLRADWYDDLTDLFDRIYESFDDEDEEEPLGGYFSKN
jgi:hypothetical protein